MPADRDLYHTPLLKPGMQTHTERQLYRRLDIQHAAIEFG